MELGDRVYDLELKQRDIIGSINRIEQSLKRVESGVEEVKAKLFENGLSYKVRKHSDFIDEMEEIKKDLFAVVDEFKEKKKDAAVGKWIVRITLALIAFAQFVQMFGSNNALELLNNLLR